MVVLVPGATGTNTGTDASARGGGARGGRELGGPHTFLLIFGTTALSY